MFAGANAMKPAIAMKLLTEIVPFVFEYIARDVRAQERTRPKDAA